MLFLPHQIFNQTDLSVLFLPHQILDFQCCFCLTRPWIRLIFQNPLTGPPIGWLCTAVACCHAPCPDSGLLPCPMSRLWPVTMPHRQIVVCRYAPWADNCCPIWPVAMPHVQIVTCHYTSWADNCCHALCPDSGLSPCPVARCFGGHLHHLQIM